jgi:hypothetical protein
MANIYLFEGFNSAMVLVLLIGVQLFLSFSLLPLTFEGYTASIKVKSARSDVEQAAKDLDELTYFTTNLTNYAKFTDFMLKYDVNDPRLYERRYKYQQAKNRWSSSTYLVNLGYTDSDSFTPTLIPTSFDSTGVQILTADMYVPSFASLYTNGRVGSDIGRVATFDFKTPMDYRDVQLKYKVEKAFSDFYSPLMVNSDLLISFLFFQIVVAFFLAIYVAISFKRGNSAKFVPIFSLTGFALFCVGWFLGYSRNNAFLDQNETTYYISNSWLQDIFGTPTYGILSALWILITSWSFLMNSDGGISSAAASTNPSRNTGIQMSDKKSRFIEM